ncbi:2-amino-4-hydroxy-6-hydroxymethyldihydropteridine diphosphokinase [Clostridium septicum]|uniref:Bifunctional folate synthesis protein n=1 Tax=Clostridium septicum TaxID=1504 RepID=A0A9N7PM42_CLOSE|nr:2-amino-4-hydroxy-6-hydroxymethyldihydropteridine diphosphokinase [Clostridium septicum]AYE35371.1 2-amino-4-hydroxy-6-hydroxymethyldihydropteridine pyrophosphokinase [Clostridium septicum]MDU1315406.1 2-amino-4-hydroxy-6-hydroxymethyldihydropteridine diphosphokinase [Clostridium septicum]QAS60762.1 2-amino-4-hydroxy-6-hydroxymethyldihydropteridine diphosphokinase [Clostridium septicum]UEC19974.1 2-amino-4-hydroxy-6-hydroxymethyldihydropteridine diphosphokinase [Clostridium septicum]USS0196
MDKLYLENIEIFANHGVFQEEKNLGQKFIISLELKLDTREAAITGDLTKSVHYGELCHKIEEEFQKESYDLIETVAEKVAEFILFNYKLVKEVKVTLKKPWAPINRHLDYAAIEIVRGWHKAYIALGSNIGGKEHNIKEAINRIKENKNITVSKVSNLIETEPWGFEDQDTFINGVIEVETILSPKELIKTLLSIENDMKRERILRWGPRIIDLDIIFYDDLISNDEEVIIPHPRMEEREFVLEPLNEIAPNMLHPILNKRVFQLLRDIKKANLK